MTTEQVPGVRYVFNKLAVGTMVTIPRRRNYFVAAFLTLWLGGWGFGEFTVGHQLITKPFDGASIFMIFWFGAWTIGGAWAIWTWIQMMVGKEVVRIDARVLALTTGANPFKPTTEYDLHSVKHLRTGTPALNSFGLGAQNNFWAGGAPSIKFDYGASTVTFGNGMEEAEAATLVEELIKRHPALG